jgi:hypothetical protein
MARAKLPWMMFYVNDHRAEHRLQLCSMAARGLWFEMLCLMFVGEPHGYLSRDSMPISASDLARLTGQDVSDVTAWLEELRANKVFSTNKKGIYSRRMLRDAKKREQDRANGRKGGNPRLKRRDDNMDNPGVNPRIKPQSPEVRSQRPEAITHASHLGMDVPVPVPVPMVSESGFATELLELVRSHIPVAEANPIIVAEYASRWLGFGWRRATILKTIQSVLARPRDETKQFSLLYFQRAIEGATEQVSRIRKFGR